MKTINSLYINLKNTNPKITDYEYYMHQAAEIDIQKQEINDDCLRMFLEIAAEGLRLKAGDLQVGEQHRQQELIDARTI